MDRIKEVPLSKESLERLDNARKLLVAAIHRGGCNYAVLDFLTLELYKVQSEVNEKAQHTKANLLAGLWKRFAFAYKRES